MNLLILSAWEGEGVYDDQLRPHTTKYHLKTFQFHQQQTTDFDQKERWQFTHNYPVESI